MGTWGTGVFDDDVAQDAAGEFAAALDSGLSAAQAADHVMSMGSNLAVAEVERVVLVVALATLLLEHGVRTHLVLDMARDVVTTGSGLEAWEQAEESDRVARRDVYDQLAIRLSHASVGDSGLQSQVARGSHDLGLTSSLQAEPQRGIPYREGDYFAVPLRVGGYGLGLVARANGENGILGYFFGPKRKQVPTSSGIVVLTPEDAVLIRICSDLALQRGEWPVVATHPAWSRRSWPVPMFRRVTVDRVAAWLVAYDEDTLEPVHETPISLDEAQDLPDDAISGSGALEITLTKLLSNK